MDDAQIAAHQIITSRRSIRRYRPEPVARNLVDSLLACAAAAPSAHNCQPWRFALVDGGDARTCLAREMGARLRADRLRDGDPADMVEADIARSYLRITEAPVLIIVALTIADMDSYRDIKRSNAEHLMAVQSTAMAMQNLLLAAHAAGLGACVMCAPLFCPDTVRAALQLPADWEPQAAVTVGWPAKPGKTVSRRSMAELVTCL